MKQGTGLDFRSWVERVVSGIKPGTRINEVPLPGTGTRIYVFQAGRRVLFGLADLPGIFECFGLSVRPEEVDEHMRASGSVEKLDQAEGVFGGEGLDVVCSDSLDSRLFDEIRARQAPLYSDRMPGGAEGMSSDPGFSLGGYGFGMGPEGSGRPHGVGELYPFNHQWTDRIMDGILKSIYTSDGKPEDRDARRDAIDSSRAARGRHMKYSGSLKDRPFVCTYSDCKRAFKRYEHLKRHNLMHTGERPHKCRFPGCSKAFSRSDNLSQHYKIHSATAEMHTKGYGPYRYLNKEFN